MSGASSSSRKRWRMLLLRLSYAHRKVIKHRSVRQFESFSAYQEAKFQKYASLEEINFARQCIELGDPQRLLEESSNFSSAAWLLPNIRKNVFIALVATKRLSEARDLLRDTLTIGAFDSGSLTRMLGDAYLLEDDLLLEQCARALMTAVAKPKALQQIYVLDTVRLSLGRDAMMRVGHLTGQSAGPDLNFFLSNLRFDEGDYAAQLECSPFHRTGRLV